MAKVGRREIFPRIKRRFTGRCPASVSIEGQTLAVKTWREILLKTCELVQSRKPSDFSKILGLRGTKRPWFSREPNELKDPVRIHGTDIFAEANENANGIVLRSLHVLNLFGFEPKIDITFHR